MNTLKLEYEITWQDNLNAYQATLEYNFSRRWVRWGIVYGMSAFLLVSSLSLIWISINDISNPVSKWYIILGCVSLLIGIVFPIIMQPKYIAQSPFNRRSYKRSWQNKLNQKETRIFTVTEDGLTLKGETFDISWQWQACQRFFESEQSFLIRFFTGEARTIPKRVFNEAQLHEFRGLLHKHIKHSNSSPLWNWDY